MKWVGFGWILMSYGICSLLGDPRAAVSSYFHQREVLAACLVLEAGGEGHEGMQAVMNVIQNRAKGNPDFFYAEVTSPWQFTSLSSAPGILKDYAPLIEKARAENSWEVARQIVDTAYDGKLNDVTHGATYFYAFKKGAPDWASTMQETRIIGGHRFMEPRKES